MLDVSSPTPFPKFPIAQTRHTGYRLIMHLRCHWQTGCRLLLSALLMFAMCSDSPAKTIRLRNGFIDTAAPESRARLAVNLKPNAPAASL